MDNKSNGGPGITTLLTVAFVVLKLTGHIDWTWFWIVSPIWISMFAVLALSTILAVLEQKK